MTAIVALRDSSGKIWMAGDRQATTSDTKIKLSSPKVLNINGYLIGFAGSLNGEKLSYSFKPRRYSEQRGDLDSFMQLMFLKDLKDFYDEWWISSGTPESDLSLIVAVNGKIYEHNSSDMSMTIMDEPYTAIGSGDVFALGALYATENTDLSAEKRVSLAIEAANKFSPYCGFGIDVISD